MFRNKEIFRYTERNDQKMFVDKIFERATIRGIADYMLFGLGRMRMIGVMRNGWMKYI